MEDRELSAADPRPDGEPYYIDSDCPLCGESLELYDKLPEGHFEGTPLNGPESSDPIWHDEWVCPNCMEGVRLDWPNNSLDEEDIQNGRIN